MHVLLDKEVSVITVFHTSMRAKNFKFILYFVVFPRPRFIGGWAGGGAAVPFIRRPLARRKVFI